MIGILILVLLAFLLWNLENSTPLCEAVGEVLLKEVAYPDIYPFLAIPEPLERYFLVIEIKEGEKVKEVRTEVGQKLYGLVKEGGGAIITYRRGGLTGRIKILEIV